MKTSEYILLMAWQASIGAALSIGASMPDEVGWLAIYFVICALITAAALAVHLMRSQ